jgi:hypothetical protein
MALKDNKKKGECMVDPEIPRYHFIWSHAHTVVLVTSCFGLVNKYVNMNGNAHGALNRIYKYCPRRSTTCGFYLLKSDDKSISVICHERGNNRNRLQDIRKHICVICDTDFFSQRLTKSWCRQAKLCKYWLKLTSMNHWPCCFLVSSNILRVPLA